MKALVFERNLPRFAASRVASLLGLGAGGGYRPPPAARRRPPPSSRRGVVPPHPAPLGHLRVRPGHAGRPELPLLRGPGQLPLRPRPRGGRDPRGRGGGPRRRRAGPRHPGGHRAGARLRPAAHPPALPLLRRGPDRPVRQRGLRRPRARPADRVLRRHRRRLVHGAACAPTPPSSTPCPTSFTDEDAVMVEPTACAVHAVLSAGVDDGDVVAVIGAGTLGPGLHRGAAPPGPAGAPPAR